jgi:hypothetical protein
MPSKSWIATGLSLFLVCGLAACATRDSGYKISNDTIAFIQPGVTTRAEVLENLGQPLIDIPDLNVAAYSWGKMRVSSNGKSAAAATGGVDPRQSNYSMGPAPSDDDSVLVESNRWAFCIAYTEQGKVARIERIHVEGAPSLEKAVRDWAMRK